MTRVVLYARYSSDLQRDASIADQLRDCRARAESLGWNVVGEYADAAISGASLMRPGIQDLMQVALQGGCEAVLAEAMDRFSRDLADTAMLFKRLRHAGVDVVTLSEGAISSLHIGLKGTMNEIFLQELAAKTRRGLRGRVEAGKSGGGLCYGYRAIYAPEGQPRGDREIHPVEANVVRRVYKSFIDGVAPKAIARALNREGVAGPRAGVWSPSTIHGHAERGTGILNNELYVGRLVWNKQRYVKDPDTGRRLARRNPQTAWVVKDVPHLRIIDDDTWERAKARQATTRQAMQGGIVKARRPRHLFSGLTVCAVCQGGFTMGSKDGLICYNARQRGTCTNRRRIHRQELESRVLRAMCERLFDPGCFEAFCESFTEELNRLRREQIASQAGQRRELAGVERRLKEIVRAIGDGFRTDAMKGELEALEAQKSQLVAALRVPNGPALHPKMAQLYRRQVTALAAGLQHTERQDEARLAVRGLIDRIVIPPEGLLEVVGNLGSMLSTAHGKNQRCGIDGCGGGI